MDPVAADRAFTLVDGFRATQAVRVVSQLKVPDLVSDGPKSPAELAEATGVLEDPLRRVLQALVSVGVFEETEDGRFGPTAISECFTDKPGTLRAWAVMLPREGYAAFAELMYTVETGMPAYDKIFGEPRFETLSKDPDGAARFNMAMQRWTEQVAGDVVEAYDFSSVESLIDVGGGTGTLVAAILAANPHLRGAVFDLPAGLKDTEGYLRSAGVSDRCEVVEGSFFESVPSGFDLYVLKSIIHDWSNEQSVAILSSCRAAMDDGARLVLVERLMPERAAENVRDRRATFIDLHMMVMLGGRERNAEQFSVLFDASGLRLGRVVEAGDMYVIEAEPVVG
jgi:precorrin-6B methylase 2